MGRSRNNAKVRSRKRLRGEDIREHENTARRDRRLNPVVRERENTTRRDLHEIEQLNPLVWGQENAAR